MAILSLVYVVLNSDKDVSPISGDRRRWRARTYLNFHFASFLFRLSPSSAVRHKSHLIQVDDDDAAEDPRRAVVLSVFWAHWGTQLPRHALASLALLKLLTTVDCNGASNSNQRGTFFIAAA